MTIPGTHQPVIPHLDESLRQHVLQESPYEFFGTHSPCCLSIARRLFVLESDPVMLQLQDPLVADRDSEDVRPQILEGCLSAAD
jgi:hypothetical protein